MTRTIALILLAALAFCYAGAEVQELTFTIDHFDNGGKFCGDKETMIIVPGTHEGAKPGVRFDLVRKDGQNWKKIGEVEVIWAVDWESSARAHLWQGETMVKIDDRILVRTDPEKGFKIWWDKATAWEKQNNWYDAFRAYYRCYLYKPGDAQMNFKYLHSGYMDYLTQGKEAMKRKNFRAAIGLFKTALLYKWPEGDVSEAEKLIKECEEKLTVERDDFSDKYTKAAEAAEAKDYLTALRLYRQVWLYQVSAFGTDEERKDLQARMKAVWSSHWRSLKAEAGRAIKMKKNVQENFKAMYALRHIVPIIEDIRSDEYYDLYGKFESVLPPDSVGSYIMKSLDALAATQLEDGTFRYTMGGSPQVKAVGTSLAIAAFAAGGHTLTKGKHSQTLAKAVNWIYSNKASDGSILAEEGNTAQIYASWALSELLMATGDETVHGNLVPMLKALCLKQSQQGDFGPSLQAVDRNFTFALAAISLYNATKSGVVLSALSYDALKNLAYGLAGTEGKAVSLDGKTPSGGSVEEILVTGSVLAALRASGANMVGKNGLPLIQAAIGFDKGRECPEGWYLIGWSFEEFPVADWQAVYEKLGSYAIGGKPIVPEVPEGGGLKDIVAEMCRLLSVLRVHGIN
ncbi:MAG: hypothetical protein Kow00107_03450 [Planctomycetota bacterium]